MHNYGKGNECLSTVLWLSKTELLLPETLRTISQNNPTPLMDQVDQVWKVPLSIQVFKLGKIL